MDVWCSTVVDIGTQTNHSTSFDIKSNITIENIEYSLNIVFQVNYIFILLKLWGKLKMAKSQQFLQTFQIDI